MRRSKTEQAAIEWICNGETGTSSLTIWAVMMGTERRKYPSIPLDPSDFGRCYKLLRAVPAWRRRLPEVVKQHPEWDGFVTAWDELTSLYERELKRPDGMAPDTYARMKQIRGVGR